MRKISGAGHVLNQFVTEDAATNRPPTEVTDIWLNDVQNELAAAAQKDGAALGESDHQLADVLGARIRHFATGAALPNANIGPIWHDDYNAIMTWQSVTSSGVTYTGYASAMHTQNSQIFTVSGNFTVPDGITVVIAEVWGGGAGGQGGLGASGGGGGYARKKCTVTPGEIIPVTVGAGGLGSIFPANSGGGGTSSFGGFCSATGGLPVAGVGNSGGSGVDGDINLFGENGSDIYESQVYFALGGACANGGGGGTLTIGGSSPNCNPGKFPGGGGSAFAISDYSGASSNGASGAVFLSW